jgi:hypothetical protein
MVNDADFTVNKSRILFILSYMADGAAELWSNAYVDKALQSNNWEMWQMFTNTLAQDFGDDEEPH